MKASATAAGDGNGTNNCLASLDPIYETEFGVEDDSNLREYILCPDTTFPVANTFHAGSPTDGQYPIIIARSNVHILCGWDGNSQNNCIIEGGLAQVAYIDRFETNKTIENAMIKGVTFTKAKYMNVEAQAEGDLTLYDCIFKVGIQHREITRHIHFWMPLTIC